jgi:hypothetical protein
VLGALLVGQEAQEEGQEVLVLHRVVQQLLRGRETLVVPLAEAEAQEEEGQVV